MFVSFHATNFNIGHNVCSNVTHVSFFKICLCPGIEDRGHIVFVSFWCNKLLHWPQLLLQCNTQFVYAQVLKIGGILCLSLFVQQTLTLATKFTPM